MDNDEEIILEIEEELLTCKKSILIEHSEYFKVMFEGNFIERYQAVIKLHVSWLTNVICRYAYDIVLGSRF